MASLSHNTYDIPGSSSSNGCFILKMDVLFWGWYDFQISFSNMSYVKERLNSSLLLDIGWFVL